MRFFVCCLLCVVCGSVVVCRWFALCGVLCWLFVDSCLLPFVVGCWRLWLFDVCCLLFVVLWLVLSGCWMVIVG